MTKENLEEKVTQQFNDLAKYEYGNVSLRALSREDISTSIGALKQLAKDFGNGADYEAFVEYTLSSEEGIKKAASVYGKKFNDAISGIAIKDLYAKRYDSVLKGYLSKEEDLAKIKNVFNDFLEETYGDITKKYSKAKEKLKSNTGNFSDEDKMAAKKVVEKYDKIFNLLNLLEEAKYEELRPKAVKNSLKMNFEDYVAKLTRG